VPYTKKEERQKFEQMLVFFPSSCTPGDLNYVISKLCLKYIQMKGINYTHLNDVTGVLDSASKEFYRRVVAPYEDNKIKQNGDIYD
jgi:hypothetical protein